MFALTALLALLQLASVLADPTPLEPSANSIFNEGSQCTLQWTADPTGVWKVMNIELMTGSNKQMVHLRTVGTVDGTSTTNNTYSYPCLAVDPNSQIYFYQFTSPSSTTVLWTTRFTIADASGKTVPPLLQETNAAGEIVRYGIGKLEDQSLVDSPPAYGTNGTSSSVNATTTSSYISTAPPNGVATPTITLPSTVSTNNGNNKDNSNSQSAALNSSTPKPSQSQTGSALSYKHTAGFGFLATAVLCGSMFL